MNISEKYNYQVAWSEEDQVFIGRVAEWPSLAAHGDSQQGALDEIMKVVGYAIELCEDDGDTWPKPFSTKKFSGRFNVRMSHDLHRELVSLAALQSVSLNQYVVETLADSAGVRGERLNHHHELGQGK